MIEMRLVLLSKSPNYSSAHSHHPNTQAKNPKYGIQNSTTYAFGIISKSGRHIQSAFRLIGLKHCEANMLLI